MARRLPYLFIGEKIVLIVRPHPIVLARDLILPFLGIVIAVAFPNWITLAILLVLLLRFLWEVLFWWHDRYVLTNDRMISLSGVFNKKAASMPLAKITDATYERSWLGRIFGYGLLNLESAGQVGFDKIDFLPDPDNFYRAVMSLALGAIDDAAPEVKED